MTYLSERCVCGGEGWLCEQHPERAWPHDDCAGPGMPCTCNPGAALPDGFTVVMTAKDGYAN
jgi:hypothetical protein